MNLFDTPVSDEKPAETIEPEVLSVKGYTKERKPKVTCDEIFADLPTREVVVGTLTEEEKQAKKTQVTKSVAKKVVKNWILADENNDDIEQFVLVTDREVVTDVFDDLDVDEIFEEVNVATGNKSIDAKVKLIGYTEAELKQKVRDILSKASMQKYENIDAEVENKFKNFLLGLV